MIGDGSPASAQPSRVLGRYALFGEIGSGGMATVHLGRLAGPKGFSRLVAIKQLHAHVSTDPRWVTRFIDEAHLASRIQHPNVVTTLDIVTAEDEVFLVMEYVHGESLATLIRRGKQLGEALPLPCVVGVLVGALYGLHAAHVATSDLREPLGIVHCDVSPQNILVGVDGVPRVLDFGVAKAALDPDAGDAGDATGKMSYMAPEQLGDDIVDCRTDVFAAGVVLWEALCGRRLFAGSDAGEILGKLVTADIPEPREYLHDIPPAINRATMRALERDPERRFQTARDFAIALEESGTRASQRAIGEWVQRLGGEALVDRERLRTEVENASYVSHAVPEPIASFDVSAGDLLASEPGLDAGWGGDRAGHTSGSDASGAPATSGTRAVEVPPLPASDADPEAVLDASSLATVAPGRAQRFATATVLAETRGPSGNPAATARDPLYWAVLAFGAGGALAYWIFH